MVIVTPDLKRADIAETVTHMRATLAALTRQGHEGLHLGCVDCERYAAKHGEIDELLICWERAEA